MTAQDQAGKTDAAFAGNIHFASSDTAPGIALPPDSPLTSGQGSFQATLSTAGSQTITASDAATGSIKGTLTVNVRAASASRFVLVTTESPQSGSSFSFSVTARDQSGNTDTAYRGTIHFTSSDTSTGVRLPPDSALTNGQGTFAATLISGGSQTITATDTQNASISGTSGFP